MLSRGRAHSGNTYCLCWILPLLLYSCEAHWGNLVWPPCSSKTPACLSYGSLLLMAYKFIWNHRPNFKDFFPLRKIKSHHLIIFLFVELVIKCINTLHAVSSQTCPISLRLRKSTVPHCYHLALSLAFKFRNQHFKAPLLWHVSLPILKFWLHWTLQFVAKNAKKIGIFRQIYTNLEIYIFLYKQL